MQKKLQIVLVMLVVIVLGTVSMRTWYGGKADRSDTSLPAGHIAAVAAMQKNKADTKEPAYAETKTGEETQKGQIARTAEDIEKQIKKEQLARQATASAKKKAAEMPQKTQEQKRTTSAFTHKAQAAQETDAVQTGKQPVPGGGSVTYITYEVQRGDTFWLIAQKFGIPMTELLSVNKLSENTTLYEGMTLTVPQHHIPEKSTPGPQYGELLDWWTGVQYLWPIGTDALVTDLATGKSFHVRRSYGAFHADVEPLTAADSVAMKAIWGGWSWATRPVVVEVNGRRIAASSHAMPHSIQTITDNDFDGHFCIHFLNSTRHSDNHTQPDHQENVRRAAGLM